MMRSLTKKKVFLTLLFSFASLCLSLPAHAQNFITVTATVTDPNGIPYAGGTMNAVLVPGTPGGWTLGGQPYSGRIGPIGLDSTGSFTANFGSNAAILPASTQWQITVGSNPGGIAPPLGTGAQSFTVTMTISGPSPQSISSTLNAAAPKLTNFVSTGTGTVTSVAATAPIVVTPNPITGTGTVSCPTCSTGTPPGGTLGADQFNASATTFGGDLSILDASAFAGADWGAQLAACIAALPAAGGTCDGRGLTPGSTSTNPFATYTVPVVVWFGVGKFTSTVNWIFNAPSLSGALAQATVLVRGSGNGTCGDNQSNLCSLTGTTLDFTAAAGIAHIDTQGYGFLEISNLMVQDDSGGTVPMFQTTCTTSYLHDNSFVGSVSGFSANQDVIQLGTLGSAATGCAHTGSAFQGYGTHIERNAFFKVRRWVIGYEFSNDVVVRGNYSGQGTNAGGNLNGPAIDWTNGVQAKGVNIENNIIEVPFYTYGIQLSNQQQFRIATNGVWDSTNYNVTAATCTTGTVTLTLSATNIAAVGQKISVVAVNPSGYNVTNVALTAENPTGPSTVSYTVGSCPGAYVSGGQLTLTAAGVLSQNGTNLVENVIGISPGVTGVPYFDIATDQSTFLTPSGASYMASNIASLWVGTATGDTPLGVVNPTGFVGTSSPAAKYGFGIRAANNLADKIVFATDNTDGFIQTFGGVLHLNTQGQNVVVGNATPITFTPPGQVQAASFGTNSNCSSSASPAVCGSAASGTVAMPTNAVSSSIQVNTTAVTANSEIFVQSDDTLGTKLGVTCNSTLATLVGGLTISARSAGSSFTIANNVAIVTNPLCLSYHIIN